MMPSAAGTDLRPEVPVELFQGKSSSAVVFEVK